jgi:hypothetical protein
MADVDMFTQDGEEWTVDTIQTVNAYVHFGTDGTEAQKADAALIAPSDEARVLGVMTQPAADVSQWVGTITDATGQTIRELGLFSTLGAGVPPAGGILIARGNVAAGYAIMLVGDEMENTCTLEFT